MRKRAKKEPENFLKYLGMGFFSIFYIFISIIICYGIAASVFNLFSGVPIFLSLIYWFIVLSIYCCFMGILESIIISNVKKHFILMIICCIVPIVFFYIDYIKMIYLSLTCDYVGMLDFITCALGISIPQFADVVIIVAFALAFMFYIMTNYINKKKRK